MNNVETHENNNSPKIIKFLKNYLVPTQYMPVLLINWGPFRGFEEQEQDNLFQGNNEYL